MTRCGGGARGIPEDSLEGPVSGVASPGSMASSTTGPTTSLNRPPSLLISTVDLKDTTISSSRDVGDWSISPFPAKSRVFSSNYAKSRGNALSPRWESVTANMAVVDGDR